MKLPSYCRAWIEAVIIAHRTHASLNGLQPEGSQHCQGLVVVVVRFPNPLAQQSQSGNQIKELSAVVCHSAIRLQQLFASEKNALNYIKHKTSVKIQGVVGAPKN